MTAHWAIRAFTATSLLAAVSRCGSVQEPDPTAQLPDQVSGPIAIVGVNVIPMTGPEVLRDQTVLVDQGRIVALGARTSTAVPEGTIVLEVPAGTFVMPGLADMHTHVLDRDELLLYLANGVTTIRNLHGLRRHLAWRDSLANQLMVGPRLFTSGPILDGDPPARSTNTVIRSAAEAAAAVAEQADLGFDYIKIYDNLPRALYQAIGQAAADRGIMVTGHLPTPVGLDGLFGDRIQSEVQHLEEFLPFLDDGRDPTLVDSIVRSLRAGGVVVVPTLSVFRSASDQAERLSSLWARPEMAYVNPATMATWGWEPTATSRSGQPGAIARYRRTVGFFQQTLLPALARGGVTIVAGTDAPIPMVIPGFAIHDELAGYLAAGFTPFEVLRTATTAAARVIPARYHLEALGTIVVGAPADLLLLSANPLDRIDNLKRRLGVVARGRWFSQRRLQRSLDSLAEVYRH